MTAPPAITTDAAAATLVSGHAWRGTTVTYSIPSTFSTWPAYGGRVNRPGGLPPARHQ